MSTWADRLPTSSLDFTGQDVYNTLKTRVEGIILVSATTCRTLNLLRRRAGDNALLNNAEVSYLHTVAIKDRTEVKTSA